MAAVSEEFVTEPLGDGSTPAFRIAGDIDLVTSPRLANQLELAAQRGGDGDVVIDLADVAFLDSTGLRVLVVAHANLHRAGRRLVLVNPSEPGRRVLELAGLLPMFGFDRDV